MAVTLQEISSWLDKLETKHHLDEDREVVVYGFGSEEQAQSVYIRAKEDGEMFEVNMQLLDDNKDNKNIKDHEHASKVLQHMLYLNYKTKFGTWEFDPSDGDIRLAVEIPLEDAIMTEKQFYPKGFITYITYCVRTLRKES